MGATTQRPAGRTEEEAEDAEDALADDRDRRPAPGNVATVAAAFLQEGDTVTATRML